MVSDQTNTGKSDLEMDQWKKFFLCRNQATKSCGSLGSWSTYVCMCVINRTVRSLYKVADKKIHRFGPKSTNGSRGGACKETQANEVTEALPW